MLAVMASAAALYLAFDYQAIGERAGLPLPRDMVIGLLLLFLLLEAARRAVGPALPRDCYPIHSLQLLQSTYAYVAGIQKRIANKSCQQTHA